MSEREPLLPLVDALVAAPDRAAAATALARRIGADDLIVFVVDPDTGALLPARGFPTTLPRGLEWQGFLARCAQESAAEDELPSRRDGPAVKIRGLRARDGSILVLLGGRPRPELAAAVVDVVPLVALAFGLERRAQHLDERAAVLEEAAARAQTLAGRLDQARRDLQRALRRAEDAHREARQAVRARDEFISIASHELQTPLTSMTLVLHALQARLQQASRSPEGLAYLEGRIHVAVRGVERLSSLVSNLLDLSRIESGRLRIDRVRLDLAALVVDVVERYQESAAQAGCMLHLCADGPIVGELDRLRMDQVVTNLLANALKYGAGAPVRVLVERAGGIARISVRDGGIGIQDADAARLFGKFERAAMARSFGGLGLGLYITREIVSAHGGTVRVENNAEGGCTFTVEVPLSEERSSP